MGKLWVVASKDLRQLSRDRGALIMMFVVPLLLVGLLGSVLGNAFNSASKVTAVLPVVNHDRGPGAAALLAALRRSPSLRLQTRTNESTVRREVRDGDRVGVLIIPAGFSRTWRAAHGQAAVTYYSVSNNTSPAAQIARDTVQSVVQRFAFEAQMARAVTQIEAQDGKTIDSRTAVSIADAATRRLSSAPPVAVRTVEATGRKFSATDNTVPGYALMFALFGIMAGARTFLEERESGTLKRLLIAPLSPAALLGGKLLAQFLQSLVQIAVLLGAGALLFGINLGSSLPALVLLVIATSFAATGLGAILIAIVRSERQVRPITMVVVLSFSALGGSWWPISVEPGWMQSLAKLTVNGWAMEGFNGLMIFDKGLFQVLPDILALLAYGMICLAIARRTLRFA